MFTKILVQTLAIAAFVRAAPSFQTPMGVSMSCTLEAPEVQLSADHIYEIINVATGKGARSFILEEPIHVPQENDTDYPSPGPYGHWNFKRVAKGQYTISNVGLGGLPTAVNHLGSVVVTKEKDNAAVYSLGIDSDNGFVIKLDGKPWSIHSEDIASFVHIENMKEDTEPRKEQFWQFKKVE